MNAQANEDYQFLVGAVGHIDLGEFLRPHLSKLFDDTTAGTELATLLHSNFTISREEWEMCRNEPRPYYQNMRIYIIVMKKNAGKELFQALLKSENHHILQFLRSKINPAVENQKTSFEFEPISCPEKRSTSKLVQFLPTFESSTDGKSKSNVSILKTDWKVKETPENEWIRTIGEGNLSRLNETTLDWTLARIATASPEEEPAKYFNQSKFSSDEEQAILDFINCQLLLDHNKNAMTRPPREVYINTRSFPSRQWERISTMLYRFGRDTLENLWLESVDCREYNSGTNWMTSLNTDGESYLWFTNQKVFIFQGTKNALDRETLHKILVLIKSTSFSLQDFWNTLGCQVQIWAWKSERCQMLLDPAKGILYLNCIAKDLENEIADLFYPSSNMAEDRKKIVPVVKLYYDGTRANLFKSGMNRQLLTHLFLFSTASGDLEVIEEVMSNLVEFKQLQKLGLRGSLRGTVNLKQLDVLDHLSFLYLMWAEVNSEGIGLELFPWRKSVKTVLLDWCEFKLDTKGLDEASIKHDIIMLQKNTQFDVETQSQSFQLSKLSSKDVEVKILQEFFDECES